MTTLIANNGEHLFDIRNGSKRYLNQNSQFFWKLKHMNLFKQTTKHGAKQPYVIKTPQLHETTAKGIFLNHLMDIVDVEVS